MGHFSQEIPKHESHFLQKYPQTWVHICDWSNILGVDTNDDPLFWEKSLKNDILFLLKTLKNG